MRPGFILPCLPTKAPKPPSGGIWLHEIKHDGFRVIARKDGPRVGLYSRLGNDLIYRFPLIVEALARLRSRSCVIDGEAVSCDDEGRPSVDRVHRMAPFILICLLVFLTLSARCALADDEQVWAALKQGGKVILLRHTHVDVREGIGRLVPGNCAAEVNLTVGGVQQAKRIGEAFHAHDIAVGKVLASPYCRCMDTGKLAFGPATAVEYLVPPGVVSDSQAKSNNERMLQEILKHRDASNLVMITHDLNISNILLEPTVHMGEFFVLQPDGADFDVIGKIRMGD
jgi:phosphohistidine phosphatase SixA